MKSLQGLPAIRTSSVIYSPIHSPLLFVQLNRRNIHHISNLGSGSSSTCFPSPFLKPLTLCLGAQFTKRRRFSILSYSSGSQCSATIKSDSRTDTSSVDQAVSGDKLENQWSVQVVNPNVSTNFVKAAAPKFSLSDQAFFLLAFIACTTAAAFVGFVAAAVPTLLAMAKAASSLAKLADTAREELPSTMAAIRLSGMEISDLTLELSDLSHDISDGVNKSVQVVQAAETGVRQIGDMARERTASMIQERANLPSISVQPAVYGAAKRTSRAVGQATRNIINFISRRSEDDDDESEVDEMV